MLGAAAARSVDAPRWFAIHTRSRHEKKVEAQLAERHIEVFLPLRREVHRWRDRFQKVDVPMFSGYVFAQFSPETQERLTVLKTPGVVRIVGFGQRDAAVPGEQIAALRRVTESGVMLERNRYLRSGQRVKIISGTLAGVEGVLVRVKNQDRLVISVKQVRQSVALEISGYDVVPAR